MTTVDVKRAGRDSDAVGVGRPRRRLHPVAVGLLVGAVALGIFVALTPAGQRSESVLAVSAPVAAGAQLTPNDLKVLHVSRGSGLAVIPAAQETSVLGRPVTVGLVAGQLLGPADVGTPPASNAQVGLALAAGEYPPNLAAGEPVLLLLGRGSGSANGNGPVISSSSRTVPATVVTVAGSQSRADEVLVTVAVAPGSAAVVAAAAAVGGVAVVGS